MTAALLAAIGTETETEIAIPLRAESLCIEISALSGKRGRLGNEIRREIVIVILNVIAIDHVSESARQSARALQ